jgi:hypothetical protein
MSESVDLNLDNYDLDDILALFKLPHAFTEKQLKDAKRIVLKLHPDKSGLHQEYFLFYSKAYKVLFNVWQFRSKQEKEVDRENTVYIAETDAHTDSEGQRQLLKNLFDKNKDLQKASRFNEWFNNEFEKAKVDNEDESTGYEEWLRNTEDQADPERMSMMQMGQAFVKRKEEMCKDLVVHQEIESFYGGIGGNLGSDLGREGGNYDSGFLSGGLNYQDLHKAHTESVIPVSEKDLEGKHMFSSMDEMKQYRNRQETAPMTVEESRKMLEGKNRKDDENATRRAYRLAKESEEAKKRTEGFWKNLRLLK